MMADARLVIAGGGPAAWSAAIYAGRAALKPVVFTGDSPGGQLMLTTVVENFPGFEEGIDGPVLMSRLRAQAERFDVVVREEKVTAIRKDNNVFVVATDNGEMTTQSVIIATGAQARWLGVPGEKEFVGRGVSTCAVCDAAFFRNKHVIVVGGGDAAMEDALALARFCTTVTIVHRRDSFRASKAMIDRVNQQEKITVLWNSVIEQIRGTSKVETVLVRNVETNEVKTLPIGGVFVAIGHVPATDFLRDVVELDERGYIKTGLTYPAGAITPFKEGYPSMTSVEGIFAGGDCVDFRYRQASTAAGFGVMAALDAERWLEDKRALVM